MTELFGRTARASLTRFFSDRGDTLINACLQGHAGRAAAGNAWAVLLTGDFAFLGGTPAPEAQDWLSTAASGQLILSGAGDWLTLAQAHPRFNACSTRWAFDVPVSWELPALRQLAAALPAGFQLKTVNEALFAQCRQQEALCDLCGPSENVETLTAHGAAVVALTDGQIAAGAGTYAWDDAGIEVEIDTLPAYRNRGLATACGAALILECIRRGLRPHWDAANEISVRIARRLGYPPPRPYEVILWQ